MTTERTPTTAAGRRLLDWLDAADIDDIMAPVYDGILAIEAEAVATVKEQWDLAAIDTEAAIRARGDAALSLERLDHEETREALNNERLARAEPRAVPATFPLDFVAFVAGLDSPNHSDQSRRDWCRLFFRDMQLALRAEPRAELDVERLARALGSLTWSWLGWVDKGWADGERRDAALRNAAKDVAREYAALAPEPETAQ